MSTWLLMRELISMTVSKQFNPILYKKADKTLRLGKGALAPGRPIWIPFKNLFVTRLSVTPEIAKTGLIALVNRPTVSYEIKDNRSAISLQVDL
jgi:hypothetical protein